MMSHCPCRRRPRALVHSLEVFGPSAPRPAARPALVWSRPASETNRQPIERLRPLRVRPTLVDFRLKAIGLPHPYIAEGIGDEEESLRLKRLYVTVRDLNIWAVFSTKPTASSNATGIGNTVDTDGFACPSRKLRTSCP